MKWLLQLLVAVLLASAALTGQVDKGTIVLGLPTRDGVLICADRLVSSSGLAKPSQPTTIKLTQLPGNVLFADAGLRAMDLYNLPGPVFAFSYFPHARALEYFRMSKESTDSPIFWGGLVRYVYEPIRLVESRMDDYWPILSRGVNGNVMLEWHFVVPHESGVRVWWAILTFTNRTGDFQFGIIPPGMVASSRAFGAGWGERVLEQLRTTSDARWNTLRTSSGIGRYLEPPFVDAMTVASGDAQRTLQDVIRSASSIMPEALASATSDCALSGSKGFRWMTAAP